MKIKILKKNCPFIKEIGEGFIIPNTVWSIFPNPTKFVFKNLQNASKDFEIIFDHQFSFESFEVFQDLEKFQIKIFLKNFDKKIYYKFFIFQKFSKICIFLKKAPKEGVSYSFNNCQKELKVKDFIEIPIEKSELKNVDKDKALERISFGISKKQDYLKICQRKNLLEIFPIWFLLANQIPKIDSNYPQIFDEIENKIILGEKEKLYKDFKNVFLAYFSKTMVPKFFDEKLQNIFEEQKFLKKDSSLIILQKAKELFIKMFFEQEKNDFKILPCLLKEFHSGKFLKISCGNYGKISLEWSKKAIKKIIFYPKKSFQMKLTLQKFIKTFRVFISSLI